MNKLVTLLFVAALAHKQIEENAEAQSIKVPDELSHLD